MNQGNPKVNEIKKGTSIADGTNEFPAEEAAVDGRFRSRLALRSQRPARLRRFQLDGGVAVVAIVVVVAVGRLLDDAALPSSDPSGSVAVPGDYHLRRHRVTELHPRVLVTSLFPIFVAAFLLLLREQRSPRDAGVGDWTEIGCLAAGGWTLANLWRLPSVVHRVSPAATLIAYAAVMAGVGLPVLVLEMVSLRGSVQPVFP